MKPKKSILDILLILNLVILKNCFSKNLSLSVIANILSKNLSERKLISSKKISFQNYIINIPSNHTYIQKVKMTIFLLGSRIVEIQTILNHFGADIINKVIAQKTIVLTFVSYILHQVYGFHLLLNKKR
tara:strand:- start:151 stop:537 length:387 start_codon:yes stop_codon:yes gene_type:complete